MSDTSNEFRLEIPSDRKNIHRVEDFFLNLNKTYRLPDEKFHAVLVAVTEAVNNGIIHGNKNDESKHVVVTCTHDNGVLIVKVRDEGSGFKSNEIADPLQEANLLKTGGRGVFLMKAFMESVEYNEKGNEVTMVIKT
jgi:serine/threonine-protein kinase RsbW